MHHISNRKYAAEDDCKRTHDDDDDDDDVDDDDEEDDDDDDRHKFHTSCRVAPGEQVKRAQANELRDSLGALLAGPILARHERR